MAVSDFKVKTVSKKELLVWLREHISPNLLSFDELKTGVDFCLGLDMLFPGVVGNKNIELTKTTEYSKRLNFSKLQRALNSLNVKTDIPIDGLIKGSFKDMFAFGIWFRAFFEANCKSLPKDLQKVRASHLKKWAKKKRQCESHKNKLKKDLKRSTSDNKETELKNKDGYESGNEEFSGKISPLNPEVSEKDETNLNCSTSETDLKVASSIQIEDHSNSDNLSETEERTLSDVGSNSIDENDVESNSVDENEESHGVLKTEDEDLL